MNNIKNNHIIRGIYFFFKRYFSCNKSGFGYLGNNVVLNPPLWVNRKENIFLHENTQALKNGIETMLNDELLKTECRKNVAQRVNERYNIDAVWKQMISIWNATIKKIKK